MRTNPDTGIPESFFYVALLGGVLAIGFWFDHLASQVRIPAPAIEVRGLARPLDAAMHLFIPSRKQHTSAAEKPDESSDVSERNDLLAFHRNTSR